MKQVQNQDSKHSFGGGKAGRGFEAAFGICRFPGRTTGICAAYYADPPWHFAGEIFFTGTGTGSGCHRSNRAVGVPPEGRRRTVYPAGLSDTEIKKDLTRPKKHGRCQVFWHREKKLPCTASSFTIHGSYC